MEAAVGGDGGEITLQKELQEFWPKSFALDRSSLSSSIAMMTRRGQCAHKEDPIILCCQNKFNVCYVRTHLTIDFSLLWSKLTLSL